MTATLVRLSLCAGSLAVAAPAFAAPNVLFVLVDTLRADRLGTYGCERPGISPNVDAFAAKSVVFEQGISQSNWTVPSVASLFSGLYPEAHGVNAAIRQMDPEATRDVEAQGVLSADIETLAERFQAAGFTTGALIRNGVVGPPGGYAQGFDSWRLVRYPNEKGRGGAELVTDATLEWLGQNAAGETPFFLYVHYADPHAPYDPPPPFAGMYLDGPPAVPAKGTVEELNHLNGTAEPDEPAYAAPLRAMYDSEVTYFDSQFRRVLDHLDQTGLAKDTIVVLTADHGEQLYEHGGWNHLHLWQENIQVPMIVRAPGVAPRRVKGWVEMFDLHPTVAELAGLKAPSGLSATSLVPQMKGQALPKSVAYSQHIKFEAVIDGGQKLIAPLNWPAPNRAYPTLVFDLDADPGESKDLALTDPARLERLAATWKQVKAAAARDPNLKVEQQMSAEDLEALRAMGYIE